MKNKFEKDFYESRDTWWSIQDQIENDADQNIVQEWFKFYTNGLDRVINVNLANKYNQDAPLIMRGTVSNE